MHRGFAIALVAVAALVIGAIRYLSRDEHTDHSSGSGQFSPSDPE